MYAEFPPDTPILRQIETVTMLEPVDCMMWRMERRCPNTTDYGVLCEDQDHRKIVIALCQLCANETQIEVFEVVRDQQVTNRVLAQFEFNPAYQQRIAMAEIIYALGMKGRSDEVRIATAIKANGAIKVHTREGTRWNGLRRRI